jgi:hypothetical protein
VIVILSLSCTPINLLNTKKITYFLNSPETRFLAFIALFEEMLVYGISQLHKKGMAEM